MEIRITKRLFFDALFASLLGIFMLFMPATANAQKSTGKLKAPSHPTRMDVKDRTISDLLYFPLSCIETPMPTREKGMQVVTDTFGNSESINYSPGLHAGPNFDFTYRGVPIGIAYYDWYDVSPSNIETADHVGKYKVELYVMKYKR